MQLVASNNTGQVGVVGGHGHGDQGEIEGEKVKRGTAYLGKGKGSDSQTGRRPVELESGRGMEMEVRKTRRVRMIG